MEKYDKIRFFKENKEKLAHAESVINKKYKIANILRKSNKKVIVVINKMDTKEAKDNIYDFYELGFDNYRHKFDYLSHQMQ